MKTSVIITPLLVLALGVMAQGYTIGSKASDFSLKNVDGRMVSLSHYPDAKGFIVIFTCNHCPFAVAYEDRIIELHKQYAPKGYPVVAINPNDPAVQPQDSYERMQERAKQKGFPFPYLFDEGQKVYPLYGATRTPQVYLLRRKGADLIVEYIGAIDNNHQDTSKVTYAYVAQAIDALLAGKLPQTRETKAIGCTIKTRK